MAEKLSFIVPKEFDGTRAKSFLRGYCGISAALLIKLKREQNGITADGEHIRTIDFLKEGQRVVLSLPSEQSEIDPVEGQLDIIYEDTRIINAFYNRFTKKKRPLWQKAINFIFRKLHKKPPYNKKKKVYSE